MCFLLVDFFAGAQWCDEAVVYLLIEGVGAAYLDVGYVATDLHLGDVDGFVLDVYIVLEVGKAQLAQTLVVEKLIHLLHRLEVVQLAVAYYGPYVGYECFGKEL